MEFILKNCEQTPKCDLKIMLYFKESTLDKLDESVRKIIFDEEKIDGKFCSMFYLPYSPAEQKFLFVGLGEKDKFVWITGDEVLISVTSNSSDILNLFLFFGICV